MSNDWFDCVPALARGDHEAIMARAYDGQRTTYPPQDKVFAALSLTPLDEVAVVIIGQDPYHQAGQAEGLAFSVPDSIKTPPSLRNILREVNDDIYDGEDVSTITQLQRWATQGVLLLNTTLTVEDSSAGAHAKWGWQAITDDIVKTVNTHCANVVFILWGAHAQSKAEFVDQEKHLVLTSAHPSPLSARRGFFGSKHFSQCNDWLAARELPIINW